MSPEQNEPYRWYHDTVDHVPQHPRHDHVVDRCADRCDDQLPLFSQVGRGLQGDGYRVELIRDTINDTRIRGVIIDPHTGEETEDWRTDNINGGRLSYTLNKNYNTDPKTFTITFTLERPDDSQRPENEKRGWTFTTPAIPFIWDKPSTYLSTLFLKSVNGPSWDAVPLNVTPHRIADTAGPSGTIEKLIYPDDVTRSEVNAPEPGDPNTVNLTYGKGGDIDCPTTSEEQTDINAAKQEVLNHLHADLYGGDYGKIPSELKPLMGDQNGQASVWDWIIWGRNQARDQAIDAAETHLHQDLYGGDSGPYSDLDEIPEELKSLVGDGGTATVWDWIKYWIGKISDPQLTTKDLKTDILDGQPDLYLVSIIPPSGGIPTTITSDNVLAAIKSTAKIQYYDVLPDISIAITPDEDETASGSLPYVRNDQMRLGTGEIAILCTKSGNNYVPINFSQIQLPDRAVSKTIKYPQANPENLINSGYGWAWTVNADNKSTDLYPGKTFSVSSNYGNFDLVTNGAFYGNWEIYAGLGNVSDSTTVDSIVGGWPWKAKGGSQNAYAYLFNRSTGSPGVRVQIDYARTYIITFK